MSTKDVIERWRTGRRWYWHRQSANGRIVAQSGGFLTSWGCLRNARRENPDLVVDRATLRG